MIQKNYLPMKLQTFSTTVITTDDPPPIDPTPPENPSTEMLLGQLTEQVKQLQAQVQSLTDQLNQVQMEDRWTEDSLRNLWEEMFQLRNQVEELEEEQEEVEEEQEEVEEEIEEVIEAPAIPVIPDQAPQGEPEETENKSKFLSLRNWL